MNKKVPGAQSILTDQQEEQRKEIVDLELKARYWKAQFEIRYYTLEAEKVQPEYEKYLEAQRKLQQEQMEKFQEEIAKMTEKREEELNNKAQEEALKDSPLLSAIKS